MKLRFEVSVDRKILEQLLGEAQVGDTVTYEQMSIAIGRDVRQFAFSALRGARESLVKKRVVFDCVENVGLVRLNDSQILAATEHDRTRILRVSKRALTKLSAVEFQKLDENQKKQHVARSAVFGALGMFSSSSTQKKIENHATVKEMAIGETLKLFR